MVNYALLYLKRYIDEMGGFYPCAFAIETVSNIMVSIGAYDGNEYPCPNDLIKLLERSISQDIITKKYLLSIICTDIFVHKSVNGINTKRDAIDMLFIGTNYKKGEQLFYEIDEESKAIFKEWNSPAEIKDTPVGAGLQPVPVTNKKQE